MQKNKDDDDDDDDAMDDDSVTDDDQEVPHPVMTIITKLEEAWFGDGDGDGGSDGGSDGGGERIQSAEGIAWIVLHICKLIQKTTKEQNPLKSAPEFGRMPKWDQQQPQIAAIAAFLKNPTACRSNEPLITALQRGGDGE